MSFAPLPEPRAPLPEPGAPEIGGFDRGRDLARLERMAEELTAVEGALRRLDDDSYGRCALCGEAIDDRRLAELPATADCGAHESCPKVTVR